MASMVYRYDKAASRNWTQDLGGERLSLLPTPKVRSRDAMLKLQVDYVERCVPERMALSLPRVDVGGDLQYFLVIDKYPLRKKLLPSAELRRQQGMKFPVALQRMQRVDAKEERGQHGQFGQVDQLAAPDHVDGDGHADAPL